MSESLQKVNNISVAHILKTLTSNMKARKYSSQEIALMQKEFLQQFGIEVSDIFINAQDIEVSEEQKTDDFRRIEKWIEETGEKRICVLAVWKEALKRDGKPSKLQSNKIGSIIDSFDDWKRINPYKDEKYGTQRGWEKISTF